MLPIRAAGPLLRLTAILLVAAACCPCYGQGAVESRGQPASVEGMVLEAGSGRPLRDVELRLVRADYGADDGPATVTDQDGRYKFENLVPGRLGFQLSRSGYAKLSTLEEPMPVLRLDSGRRLTDWNFQLHEEAQITGRVLDEGDSPLADIWTVVLKLRYVDGQAQLARAAEPAFTDDFGNYRLAGMAPGRHYLLADPGMNLVEPRERNAAREQEIERHYVRTFYAQSTDFTTARPFELASRDHREFDFRLLQVDTYTISASIADAQTGKPPALATVTLLPETAFQEPLTVAELKEPGAFEIRNVPSGKYFLHAMTAPGDKGERRFGSARVEIAGKHGEGIQLLLQPGIPLSGRLVTAPDEPKASLPAGMRVRLTPRNRAPFDDDETAVRVAEDGSFRFQRVWRDEYSLTVLAPPPYFVKKLTLGGHNVLHKSFVLDNMIEEPEIVAVLSAHGASIAGAALDTEGRGVPGAVVVLAPEGKDIAPAAVLECTTDQEGRFIFAGIAPGPYRLAAFKTLQIGRGKNPDFLNQYFADGIKIDLSADENENIDVKASSVLN